MKLIDGKMRKFLQGALVALGFSLALPTYAWTTITVQSGQSVDGIAEKYRPAGVSEMDMVIAVRSANPGIEYKGLRTGVKLKVPTTSTEVRQAITGELGAHTAATKTEPAKAAPIKAVSAKAVPAKPVAKKTVANKTVKPTSKPAVKPVAKTVAKPIPAAKPKTVPAPAPVDNQATSYKTTIANLQQTIASQNQSIQAYQAQITDLTKQLNDASSGTTVNKSSGLFSFADLWFFLWLVTLIFLWRARSKSQGYESPSSENHYAPSAVAIAPTINSTTATSEVVPKKSEAPKVAERIEPKLHEINEEEWRQVELDIPTSDAPAQTHMPLVPSFTPEEERELSGEQKNIIDAIANDHDNLEWHMALLEFYIKTMNDNAFKRHMDTMIHTGLMSEGDALWEKVRKMYLNGWIYKEEAA